MTDFVELKTQDLADYAELKRLAESLNQAIERAEHKPGQWAGTAQSMGGICCPGEKFQIGKSWPKEEPWAQFSYKRDSWLAVAAVNALPRLLALIAENKRLFKLLERTVEQYVPLTELEGVPGWSRVVKLVEVCAERDRLKAENETLVAAAQALRDEWRKDQAENEALRSALGNLLSLYEDDEGCRNLPEYIAGVETMAKEARS